MAVTIKDIASKANVSIATVSRYLNNPEVVSAKTGKTIQEAIEELDYTPNDIARSLITNNSYTIGLILPDINNVFYPPILRGIEDIAEQYDYIFFLCNTDQNIRREKKYIDVLLSKRAAGMIFIGTRPTDDEKNRHIFTLSKKLPVLLLYEHFEGISSITTDDMLGSYKAVNYLLDLGHRDIAFVSAPPNFSTYVRKRRGYEKALREAGIPFRDEYVVYQDAYESGGYQAMCQLLKLKNRPTAVHAVNDQMAIGVMRAALENGLKIPEDLSVVGFSNSSISSQIYPRLTTVNQFGYDVGKMAAKKIINMINKKDVDKTMELIEPELVVRNSCARTGQ